MIAEKCPDVNVAFTSFKICVVVFIFPVIIIIIIIIIIMLFY